MVICCAAPNCTNRQGKGKRGAVSFHRFPLKDSSRLYLWTAAIQRSDWTPGPYSFLCSEHFSEDSFVPRMPDQHPLLRPDAVPSLFKGGRELKRKGTFEPHLLRLRKRKHLKKEISLCPLEDEKLLVSPDEDFIVNSYDNTNRNDTMDSGHLPYPCSQHIASKFIFSLHSYSRPSATSLSQNVLNSDSSLHALQEGAHHPHDPHPKETIKLSPSLDHGPGDIPYSVDASEESLDSDTVVQGQVPFEVNITNSPVLEAPAYAVQEPVPSIQMEILPQDKSSGVLASSDSQHSYCSIAKPPPCQTKQCSKGALTAGSGGPIDYQAQGCPPLNPAVAPLAWMLGTWVSDPLAEGGFPSIPSFRYKDEAVISHVGQPMLNFTFSASHPETGKAMHRECGFIRVKPGTNQVAFICAQSTGMSEVEEGEVQGEQLTLSSLSLSRSTFAKEPHVQQVSRIFRLTAEGKLEQTVSVATSTQAMARHLHVTYKKVTGYLK